MAVFDIKTMKVRGAQKQLLLSNKQGKESTATLHRFAMVGPGDELEISGSHHAQQIVVKPKGTGDTIPISPRFESHSNIRFGSDRIDLVVAEITSDGEFQDYLRLGQFHYKGAAAKENAEGGRPPKAIGGRKAVLLAYLQRAGFSRAVGYIELQMPLLMCKPRHRLFARPFNHAGTGVSWKTWLGDGQQHVNRIARIARVVVDPEFRGLGLSTKLVEDAKTFCRIHWHIAGNRPLFIEISAEMLRYMDFVSKAGLQYVGDTEGNLSRIAKDLHSIESGAGGKSGIMSLQRKYHASFTAYCEKTGHSFNEARLILSDLLDSSDPRSEMASDKWLAFRPFLRFPIPYFIGGLDTESHEYILEGMRNLSQQPRIADTLPQKRLPSASRTIDSINFSGLTVGLNYKIPLSPHVRLIMDSFGIEANEVSARLIQSTDISLQRGHVTLLTGASGAGKSVLLQAISGLPMAEGLQPSTTNGPPNVTSQALTPLPSGVPIFQHFAEAYGPERAFDALCHVGLSEAMIFIKPFELLSMGQRYRAMFAELILSNSELWLIDEFCSNLDPITAKILSSRLRRLAKQKNIFVVVAAANTEHFIDALCPQRIYMVRSGGTVKCLTNREYTNGFFNKGF